MFTFEASKRSLPFVLALAACGGSVEPAPRSAAAPEPATSAAEAPVDEAAAAGAEAPGSGEASETPAATTRRAEPLAADAAAIQAALARAAEDGPALVAIIDPERGVGAWDRTDETKAHFCDTTRMAREPALGFAMDSDYEWRCDDELVRCSAVDPEEGSGTVFYFREADGGGRWLDTIIRYGRRVPRLDSEHVTEYVGAGEGVCALWRGLTGSADELTTEKLSVYVSRFTEGVEESTTERHCAEEATTAVRAQLAGPMEIGPPTVCSRQPLACTWLEADEVRVYGRTDGTPYAVAHLGANLNANRTRQQEREVAAFAHRASLPRCN